MIPSHRSEHHHEQFNKMNPHERHELDDRLRPVASVRSNNNNSITSNTKEHTQTTANYQDRMETRLAGRWRRPQGRNRTPPPPSPGHLAPARIHCSLPLVLLIILSSFKLDFNLQPTRPSASMLVQAQFLFTYEINQESDESRVPRSSLFDPSSFKIVTPSQLQSSYQKLASQLPEPVPAQSQPASSSPSSAAVAPPPVSPETNLAPEPNQQQAFQSLLEPPAVTTAPSTSAGSFLKQTSAAIQSFAELFHLTPSSSPTPLAGLQTPQANSQPTQPLVATNGIDQQAEARSLHEHWTQQQKRAHNQAEGSTGLQQQQVSAFQSFTTSPSVLSGPTGVQTGTSHHHQQHLQQQPPQQPQQQQQGGSQASYWLTSNPLNAPDGNFLVEIKNAGESGTGSQEAEQAPARSQHQHQHQTSQNLPSNHHHHQHHHQPQQQQQQQQPPATTASSFTRPASAQSSFLSTPTSTYFGLPANTNQKPLSAASLAIGAPIQHQTSPVAPTGPVTAHVDRFNQQNFRKPAHFQPQTQALHQHQARSLSHQKQQQQARQLVTTPTSHQQSELLDGGQLQPPANTPEHFGGGSSNVASPSLHGSIGSANGRQLAPLKSAEESLIAFRQQQQHQHDQQGALLAAVQNQFAAQTGRHTSNGELPPSTGNSLLDDELATPNHHQPASNQQHHNQHHPLESSSGDQRPKLPVGGLTSNTYSSNTQQAVPRHQQQQQQQQQAAAPPAPVEIPKVSPQIYESFLLQQKDQYEKHMELLKQQQELNKLLEQKQKQQQQQQQQEAEKRKRKKEELERLEARKKANAAREQEQQLVAARKARQEAEEARRKQLRQLEEEETKRRRQAEEERRYRELMEAREREEAKRKLKEAEEAAELARRQREQQERDALAEQQKRRREQQEAAEEAAKQQQQYKTYLKQQEELRKLLELKQKEDEAAQARQRQAGQMSQQQQQQQGGRLTAISRANKLALEHKERGRQIPQRTNSDASGSHAPSWGGRQTRVRAVTLGSHSSSANAPTEVHQSGQSFVPNTSSTPATATTSTTSTTPATPASSSAPRVGTRLSSRNGANGGLRRLKTDEKLIRQKIPNYSGAGKYGLYQSDSDELAKLLEAVTLPPVSSSSSTTTTTTTASSSTTTTTTTQAPPPASSSSSSSSDLLDSDEPSSGRSLTSSSLSPLLNLRELGVTPPSVPQAQARPTTGEPFSSTTIFDDDVPRRPVRNPSAVAAPQQQHQGRRSFPAPILPSASVASATRTTLTNRMGTSSSSSSSSSNSTGTTTHRGASIGLASLPADSDNDGIPGRAGHEYPVLAEVPQTSFSCSRMKLSGFFADTETACQVVHLCQDGAQSSILCPNGTIFNQEKFSCQWWYEVNCARAPMFYQLNDNLYKSSLGSTSSTTGSSSSSSQDSGSVELNKRTRTSTGTSTVTSNNLKSS